MKTVCQFVICLLMTSAAFSQTDSSGWRKLYDTPLPRRITMEGDCAIAGKVLDKATGKPLVGANVVVQGTSNGAATDNYGNYCIRRVPPGVYKLKATYVDYEPQEMDEIVVTGGGTSKVDFALPAEDIDVGDYFYEPVDPIRRFGAKLGVTSATWDWKMDVSTPDRYDSRLGLSVGGFLEWLNTPVVSLVSELHFIQKGMKEAIPITTTEFPNGTGEFTRTNVRLDYLSLDFLPKARLEMDLAELYAVAGVRMDLLLSSRVSVDAREPMKTSLIQGYQSLVSRFTDPQFGVTLGVGALLDGFFPVSAGIEFRYSPNLQDAYSGSGGAIRSRSFELLLTIQTAPRGPIVIP